MVGERGPGFVPALDGDSRVQLRRRDSLGSAGHDLLQPVA
jgi:hypothetical protein